MTFQEFWQIADARQDNSIRTVLFDIDGTLAAGRNPMPGANDLLDFFRKNNFPFLLLTNDSHHSSEQKCALLARAGVTAAPEEVVSCSHALTGFVRQHGLAGKLAFVMGEFGTPCYAEGAGLRVTRDVTRLDECDLIITGEGKYDWYTDITEVMNFFMTHPDRMLVCANPDAYWPNAQTGRMGVGAGAIARFVIQLMREMHIDIKAFFLGKPWPGIYLAAMNRVAVRFGLANLQPGEVLMVGDSLKSDIFGAKRLGMQSALVMTGITTPEILAAASAEERPDYVFETLSKVNYVFKFD